MNDPNLQGKRILLIEDEKALAQGLAYNLEREGYTVTMVFDGAEGERRFLDGDWDLVLLDVMLPHKDGFEIAKIIRAKAPRLPILILTARTGLEDRLTGLSLGADDYLTKPFHLPELLLRVKGMLRRADWYEHVTAETPVMDLGPWKIDFLTLSATQGRRVMQLSALEAQVIRYFLDHPNRIIPRGELLEKVWQAHPDLETRTVDNFILRLRKHFEPDPAHPRYLHSVRSVGYLLDPQGNQSPSPDS